MSDDEFEKFADTPSMSLKDALVVGGTVLAVIFLLCYALF